MGDTPYSRVVAIDGPGGSGKSTLSRHLAQKMNLLFIDTGAMYRALALTCQQRNIAFAESANMQALLANVKLQYALDEDRLMVVDGVDVTSAIREHQVSTLASQISQIASVRNYLVDFQRQLVKGRSSVMEGRDIGTVVFPNAFCKIYLTAPIRVRAQRRLQQLELEGRKIMSLPEVEQAVQERDRQDMNRTHSPLRKADDAIELDTAQMNEAQVLQRMMEIVHKSARDKGVIL
jgi:cytidylate kinase